jgi:hypothetical protein
MRLSGRAVYIGPNLSLRSAGTMMRCRTANSRVMRPRAIAVACAIACVSTLLGSAFAAQASPRQCEVRPPKLRIEAGGPDLTPPRTDVRLSGWVDLAITISKEGRVTRVAVKYWHIEPNEDWLRRSILAWYRKRVFVPMRHSCTWDHRFKLEDEGV